jgi:hypothetical protein
METRGKYRDFAILNPFDCAITGLLATHHTDEEVTVKTPGDAFRTLPTSRALQSSGRIGPAETWVVNIKAKALPTDALIGTPFISQLS